jgi:hypothetical protein
MSLEATQSDRIDRARAALARITVGTHLRCAVARRASNPYGFSHGIAANGDYTNMLHQTLPRLIKAGRQHILFHRPYGETVPLGEGGHMRYAAWAETPRDVRERTEAGFSTAFHRLAANGIPTTAYLGSLAPYAVEGIASMVWARESCPAWMTNCHIAIDASAQFRAHGQNDLLWVMHETCKQQGRTFRVEGPPRSSNSLMCSPDPWACCVSNRSLGNALGDSHRIRDVMVLRLGHGYGPTKRLPSEPAELARLAVLSSDRGWTASYMGLDFDTPTYAIRAEAHRLIPQIVDGVSMWEVE